MPRRILSRDHPEWSIDVAGVLIDMDGTLVDSTAAITRQWWTFLDWYDLPPTAFPHPLHGKRAEDHVRALVPPELVDEALQRFLDQELADVEGINPTMLSRVVGKLEEAELIQRQIDAVDRRAVRVVATTAGTKLRKRVLAERSALLADRLARLPADTIEVVVVAIPALEALVAELAPPGR